MNHIFEKKLIKNISSIIDGLVIEQASTPNFQQIINDLNAMAKNAAVLKSQKPNQYSYQKYVATIQQALQVLGYQIKIDGLFGPITTQAISKFQSANGINPSGTIDEPLIGKLIQLIQQKNSPQPISQPISKPIAQNTNQQVPNVPVQSGRYTDFFKQVLGGLGAPVTNQNMLFLHAWNKAEGGQATNNPFNTTFHLVSDPNMSNYNSAGVKNYSTPQFGVQAILKTLTEPRYSCITNGLKNNVNPINIAKCDSVKTWGTGDNLLRVLNSYTKNRTNPVQQPNV